MAFNLRHSAIEVKFSLYYCRIRLEWDDILLTLLLVLYNNKGNDESRKHIIRNNY